MKKISFLAIIFITLSAATIAVVFKQSLKDKITQSFMKGEVEELSKYFSDEIFLELFDREAYDDQVAIKNRLYIFFNQYPPKHFEIKHEGGKEHKKYSYLIGILQTEEEVFRITFTIEQEQISNIAIIFQPPIG